LSVAHEVADAMTDAARRSGGAGREVDGGRSVRGQAVEGLPAILGSQAPHVDLAVLAGRREVHDLGAVLGVRCADALGAGLRGERERGPCAVEDRPQLPAPEPGSERDDDDAGLKRSHVGHCQLGGVGKRQRQTVARA
jgi:hypothetical protein